MKIKEGVVNQDYKVANPENVTPRIVNFAISMGMVGDQIDIVFATGGKAVTAEGKLESHRIVAANLRFDLDFADKLQQDLARIVQMIKSQSSASVN